MRYINIENLRDRLPKGWEQKSNELLVQLRAAPDHEARKKIIEDNRSHWGKLKKLLSELSNKKCWYTELSIEGSYSDVDHFRPKLRVEEDKEHPGYWWLAFNHENYRLACNVSNRSVKKDHFPLPIGGTYATSETDSYQQEPYLLLDPTVESDVSLLSFKEDGTVTPSNEKDQLVCSRVEASRKCYGLDDYSESRKSLLSKIDPLVKIILSIGGNITPSAKEQFTSLIQALTDEQEVFSAFSICMLKKKALIYPEIKEVILGAL